ncbi:MAG: alpha-galactosidase [Firmicutes bacterium]|nr:alpha-galactosidase [Bacillota bacterium]
MPVVTLVGSGSVEFTHEIVSDLLQDARIQGLELRLMDRDAERLATSRRLVDRLIQEARRQDVSVRATMDLTEAVAHADYVINTILVGGRAAIERDFEILGRYGLRQTVGDTLGVSGIARAIRTIPAVLAIARTMEAVCPDAVLLNYTNPMSMLMMALDRTSPVEHYGLCHSTEHTIETLAGYLGVPVEEVEWTACGINHLAWILRLSHRGVDLYPALYKKASEPDIWRQDAVRFELMRFFGYFVTESSKHVAEYLPYFIVHQAEVERLLIPLNEYLTRARPDLAERLSKDDGSSWLLPPSGEYAPQFIGARESHEAWRFQGNVKNRAYVTNLPPGASVEVPCRMVKGQVIPEAMGALPEPLAALTRQMIAVQELTVSGVLDGNRDLIDEAVALEPQAALRLTLDQMRAVVDDLVDAMGPMSPPLARRRIFGRLGAAEEEGPPGT